MRLVQERVILSVYATAALQLLYLSVDRNTKTHNLCEVCESMKSEGQSFLQDRRYTHHFHVCSWIDLNIVLLDCTFPARFGDIQTNFCSGIIQPIFPITFFLVPYCIGIPESATTNNILFRIRLREAVNVSMKCFSSEMPLHEARCILSSSLPLKPLIYPIGIPTCS